jgi:hypothetical protein
MKKRLTLLFLFLSLACLLAIGALRARHDYLRRGIPQSLPEPIAYSDFRLGMNVYLQDIDEAALNQALEDIAGLGISAVKQPFYFQESFDWQASDTIVSAVRSQGIELVPLLDGNPDDQFAPPVDLPLQSELTEAAAANAELAVVRASASTELATVVAPSRELRLLLLLHPQALLGHVSIGGFRLSVKSGNEPQVTCGTACPCASAVPGLPCRSGQK